LPRGGWLQVYQLAERAGQGSFTLAVSDIAAEIKKLDAMGVDTTQQRSASKVKTVMVTDPDGNHIAFAEASDSTLAQRVVQWWVYERHQSRERDQCRRYPHGPSVAGHAGHDGQPRR